MVDYSTDFLDIHNDDLIEVAEYEGIRLYHIDYDKARSRRVEFIQKLINSRKEAEKWGNFLG